MSCRAEPAVEVVEVAWTPADSGARSALWAAVFGPDSALERGDDSAGRGGRHGQP